MSEESLEEAVEGTVHMKQRSQHFGDASVMGWPPRTTEYGTQSWPETMRQSLYAAEGRAREAAQVLWSLYLAWIPGVKHIAFYIAEVWFCFDLFCVLVLLS